MPTQLSQLFEGLGLLSAARLLEDKSEFFGLGISANDFEINTPPCFLPLFGEPRYSEYVGIWIKARSEKPTWSFVRFDADPARMYVHEIARTEQQLLGWCVLKLIERNNGKTDSAEEFSKRIGFSHFEEILEHWDVFRDNEKNYSRISIFGKMTPLVCVQDVERYDGDFYSGKRSEDVFLVTSYELEGALAELPINIYELERVRVWNEIDHELGGKSVVERFKLHVSDQDLSAAWSVLNSHGWRTKDAVTCLGEFAANEGSEFISDLSKWWAASLKRNFKAY